VIKVGVIVVETLYNRRKKEEGRRKKEEGRRKKINGFGH
jgi:hypothetical protein